MNAAEAAAAGCAAAEGPPEAPRPLYRDMPPAEPFPVDALGDILAPAAKGIQAKIQAPMSMCGQAVLAVASLAVQAHADIVLPMGHAKPLSLFCITVAASGERKSAVDSEALWPVRKREAALRESYASALTAHDNEMIAWTKARETAVKKAGGDRAAIKSALSSIGDAPRAPMLPMLTQDEPNWPGLCRAFDEGRPAQGLFSGEGGGFIGGHGMNDDNRLRTATGLSGVWDGEPIRRTRQGDGIKIMSGRRLAMHLMMQPGVASRLTSDPMLVDQGLTARLLIVAPDSTAGTRLWREPPPEADEAVKRYGARILSILERPFVCHPDRQNELQVRKLPLSAEARDLWIQTADHIERRLGPGGELEPVRSFANKAAEHASRIAGVLTLVRDPDAAEVAADTLADAATLVSHYLSEALRMQAAGQADADLTLARRLLDWLMTAWSEPFVSLPDIYQTGPGAIRDQRTARRLVEILAEHGWLAPAGAGEVAGKRRRETWEIRRPS